jgi:flagellar export protein FliJ
MKSGDRRFRYGMEPVIKVRRWDVDSAKADELRARQVVADRARETQRIGESIAEAEAKLRESQRQGEAIDAQWYTTLTSFLVLRRKDFEESQVELRQAQEVHDERRRTLMGAKQKLTALEKHKETKRLENEVEVQRENQKQMDDLWLLGNGRGDRS